MHNTNNQEDKGLCTICKQQQMKYKCSNCLINYCSVACYKIHKSGLCIKKVEVKQSPITQTRVSTKISLSDDMLKNIRQGYDEDEFIKQEYLEAMLNSQQIKEMLNKDKVVPMIKDILSTDNELNPKRKMKSQTNLIKQIQAEFNKNSNDRSLHPLQDLFQYLIFNGEKE